MSITLKLMILFSFTTFLLFTLFYNNLNLSFEKEKEKDNFADKNIIPICCAWGPELQDGILTYSIQGGENDDKKDIDAVTKAIDLWNQNLNGMQFIKSNGTSSSDNDNIKISFINDGKKVAGKTTNSIDGNGFIRQSYIVLSKESFNRPFSQSELIQVAKHELGHVLGLNHVNFKGNLMSAFVNKGNAKISPCLIEAVNTANSWKLKEGGISIHGPTQNQIVCK